MVDESIKGKTFDAFTFTIERGKVREFLLAIGDTNPVYQTEDPPLPPTFATAMLFWGGGGLEDALKQIGVSMQNVLHAEQEYEYGVPLHVGDMVTGQTSITNVYNRAGMNFVAFETEYVNQDGEHVLADRALIIVRGDES